MIDPLGAGGLVGQRQSAEMSVLGSVSYGTGCEEVL